MHCRSLLRERRYPWLRGEESAARAAASAESSSASATSTSSDVSERSEVRKALLAMHAIYEVPALPTTYFAVQHKHGVVMEHVSNKVWTDGQAVLCCSLIWPAQNASASSFILGTCKLLCIPNYEQLLCILHLTFKGRWGSWCCTLFW